MSRLQALHPDQQAALQLVLRRRMPYGDLAGLLGLTPEGVRERALDAVDGLAPDDVPGLQLEDRDRIADHLLGQDGGAARESTAALLRDHPPALLWATTVATELEPLGGPVPELPGAASGTPEPAAAAVEPVATPIADDAPEPAPVAEAPAVAPTVAASAGPAAGNDAGSAFAAIGTKGGAGRASNPFGSRSPRVLAGSAAAVVVLVLLVVWIAGGFSGGDDKGDSSASAPGTTTAAADGTASDQQAAAEANAARFASALPQSITLRPPSSATGAAAKALGRAQPTVSQQDASIPVLAVAMQGLPAVTSKRRYFAWADKNGADPIFLASLPSAEGAEIPFVGIDVKTRQSTSVDPSVYTTVRITRETAQAPTKPGPTVLVGRISPRS